MFTSIKRKSTYFEGAGNTTGSLQSWYEPGVGSEGAIKKPRMDNFMNGPLPLFPMLDVMEGAASAVNEGYVENWGLQNMKPNLVDETTLNFEEMLGELDGFRQQHNTEFKEENWSYTIPTEGTFAISGSNIDYHSAQASAGMHESSAEVALSSESVANEHNVGDNQEGRDAGLERGENPAINKGTGEEVYHNSEVIDTNAPSAIPMDVDAIEVDGEFVHPEDTAQALGKNGG